MQRVAGKDASKQFWKYHNEGILKKYKKQLQIGSLDSKPKAEPKPDKPATPAKSEKVEPKPESGTVSVAPSPSAEEEIKPPMDEFGDLVPYADPNWYHTVSWVCVTS